MLLKVQIIKFAMPRAHLLQLFIQFIKIINNIICKCPSLRRKKICEVSGKIVNFIFLLPNLITWWKKMCGGVNLVDWCVRIDIIQVHLIGWAEIMGDNQEASCLQITGREQLAWWLRLKGVSKLQDCYTSKEIW